MNRRQFPPGHERKGVTHGMAAHVTAETAGGVAQPLWVVPVTRAPQERSGSWKSCADRYRVRVHGVADTRLLKDDAAHVCAVRGRQNALAVGARNQLDSAGRKGGAKGSDLCVHLCIDLTIMDIASGTQHAAAARPIIQAARS